MLGAGTALDDDAVDRRPHGTTSPVNVVPSQHIAQKLGYRDGVGVGADGAGCPDRRIGDEGTRQPITVDGGVTEVEAEGLHVVDGVVHHQAFALACDEEGALDVEAVGRRLLFTSGHAGCARQDGYDLRVVSVHHVVDEPGRLELAFLARLRLNRVVQGHRHVFEDVHEPPARRGGVEVVVQARNHTGQDGYITMRRGGGRCQGVARRDGGDRVDLLGLAES